ncbi:MAG: hypothetical protein M3R38_03875 [Actinomycetota bacterium]|nr:hypothetical protein [Actinomycetota bacterium]
MGGKRAPRVASEAELSASVVDTARALREQPTRTVRLYQVPADSTDRPLPDEFVQVNGHAYQIQRGKTVEVPETVYEILEQAGRL